MTEKIKIGVSSCLLGEKVRFDGGHKLDRYIVNTLGQFFDFLPVCPEVEAGYPTPRETFRLVGDPENPRLITPKSGVDHTETMQKWAQKRVKELEKENLRAFIFKSKSPSSGMERVKVYNDSGMPEKKGIGIFARAFMDHFPLLPVEEEGRLHDIKIRENFIEKVFVLDRWKKMVAGEVTRKALIDFHTKHKMLIRAHSEIDYRALGKLIGNVKQYSIDEMTTLYLDHLMHALTLKTTVRKNVNVLLHIVGYFKKDLTADEKKEVLEIVENYRQGLVPLIVPITLLNHYIRKYDQAYLKEQYFLNPHPMELQIRNHV